jgi:hypothetical protein
VRTLVYPTNPKDLEEVHTLQDAIKVGQNSPGDALPVLGATVDSKRMFGDKDQVDPVRHLIGTARGFGYLPVRRRSISSSRRARTTAPQSTGST